MRKKSTFQIVLDRNGDLRVNNLSREEYLNLFETEDQEQPFPSKILTLAKQTINPSKLERDIQITREFYKNCNICFRNCDINRIEGKVGWCGLNASDYIYMGVITEQEEECISPTYAIYFSSCNIDCSYCHQRNLMEPTFGREYLTIEDLVTEISNNILNLKSISFIGGNPDLSILTILKIIYQLEKQSIYLPYILNSNFLFNENLYQIIQNNFDVLIPDIKFLNYECAKNICGYGKYSNLVSKNILQFINIKTTIIRHLPMKNHWKCCSQPIIDWISKHVKNSELYSLSFLDMLYYDNSEEVKKCYDFANKLGLNLN